VSQISDVILVIEDESPIKRGLNSSSFSNFYVEVLDNDREISRV